LIHGKKHWLYHRLSAIFLAPLMLWLIYSLSLINIFSYQNIIFWIGNTTNFILLFILIIISASHFQLGIQVILEDYISQVEKRNFYIKFLHVIYLIFCLLGLSSISIIYFGVQI